MERPVPLFCTVSVKNLYRNIQLPYRKAYRKFYGKARNNDKNDLGAVKTDGQKKTRRTVYYRKAMLS